MENSKRAAFSKQVNFDKRKFQKIVGKCRGDKYEGIRKLSLENEDHDKEDRADIDCGDARNDGRLTA